MKLFRRSVTYTTIGVEITRDRARTWIALAGADGAQATVELLDPFPGTEHVPTLLELEARHPIDLVALDPTSPSATLLDGLRAEAVALLPADARGMAVAHGRFLDWTTAGKLKHRGNRALTDAVREAAARRTTSGAQRVDRAGDADPSALVACELAVWALGDLDSGGGLSPDRVHVGYDADPTRLPPHLQRQADAIASGAAPAVPLWPGTRRKEWPTE